MRRILVAAVTLAVCGDTHANDTLEALVGFEPTAYGFQSSAASTVGPGSISADGRFVVFATSADNLLSDPGNGTTQIYLSDRIAGTLTRISSAAFGGPANADCKSASISADGSRVAFLTSADNLVPGDTPNTLDIIVHNRLDGSRLRIPAPVEAGGPANAYPLAPGLSADGQRMLFGAATSTSTDFEPTAHALYVVDTNSASVSRITPPLTNGVPDYQIVGYALAGNGAAAVFGFFYPSTATPPYAHYGAYAMNIADRTVELLTRAADGTPVVDYPSKFAVSMDARVVAFATRSAAYVSGDTNGSADIVVRNRDTASNAIGSLLPGHVPGTGDVGAFTLSADGRRIAFAAYRFADTYGTLMAGDLVTGDTAVVAVGAAPTAVTFAGAQSLIVFDAVADDLVVGDTNTQRDVFVRSLSDASTTRVSTAVDGPYRTTPCCVIGARPSPSGRWLGFGIGGQSVGDYRQRQFHMLDRMASVFQRVSIPGAGASSPWNTANGFGTVSDAGNPVSLTLDIPPGIIDIFPPPPPPIGGYKPATITIDPTTGDEVAIALTAVGGWPDGKSSPAHVSGDGHYAVFTSSANNLLPNLNPSRKDQVFLRDLSTGALLLVSRATTGVAGDGFSHHVALSPDGRFVVFNSTSHDLITDDANPFGGLFIWDRETAVIERVDVGPNDTTAGAPADYGASVCNGGRRIAWATGSTGLIFGDYEGYRDIFVRDRVLGRTWRASARQDGAGGNANADEPHLSADCSAVVFSSAATNLGVGAAGVRQVYARTGPSSEVELLSSDRNGVPGTGRSDLPYLSADATEAIFRSSSRNWTLDRGNAGVFGSNAFVKSRVADRLFRDEFE